ncbi:975_t:CDS:1, partial [Funneliformis caledonium]
KFRLDVKYQGLIEEITTKEELENQLCCFIHSIKKQDGTEYHASSVNNCLYTLNRHLNEKSTLPKLINILDKKVYYKLWQVFNGKVKNLANQGLAEHTGSIGFTEEEILHIMNHPIMTGDTPTGLLYWVFFFNAILLGLRGGEHFNLQYN